MLAQNVRGGGAAAAPRAAATMRKFDSERARARAKKFGVAFVGIHMCCLQEMLNKRLHLIFKCVPRAAAVQSDAP